MKLLLEIDEEDAAVIWADHTWIGKYPKSIEAIAQRVLITEANKHREAFPSIDAAKIVEAFHAARKV